ncbi:MAG: hypothetical protein C0594_00425 [Marinilabiliales bacterium]|nr:MAG: hypothetical protein C0594_00425 [Marinilabiliales bacterium]
MKKIILLISCVSIAYMGWAQTPNEKLTEIYPEQELSLLKEKSPSKIEYLNFISENIYKIMDNVPEDKLTNYPYLYEKDRQTKSITDNALDISDLANLNILKFDYIQKKSLPTTYRIQNSNKLIVILPREEVIKKFNQAHNQ